MKSFFAVCRIIGTCCSGTLTVLWIFSLKRFLSKPYQTLLNNTIRKHAKKIMKITQARYQLKLSEHKGLEPHQSQPIIYMSNHLSLLDIPLIFALMPGNIKFVAKNSLFKLPLFGKAISAAGVIPASQQNLHESLKQLLQNQHHAVALWIFPEGHRSTEGKLLDFKAGGFTLAREIKAKIIPVGIKGTEVLLPTKTLKLNPNPDISAELHIGQEINCAEFQRPEQIKDLMQTVRNEIENLVSM